MTKSEIEANAAAERRRRELERATETIEREQDARIYGVVSFHLQAGRIVRSEVKRTEEFRET